MFRRLARCNASLFLLLAAAQFCSGQAEGSGRGAGAEDIPFGGESPGSVRAGQRDAFLLGGSARRALEAGVYDVAYQLALRANAADSDLEPDFFFENELVAIDSLLARSLWVEAGTRLENLAGAADEAWTQRLALRRAMILYAESDASEVERLLAGIGPIELPDADAAWRSFLLGWSRLAQGRGEDYTAAFEQAKRIASGVSPDLAAQIQALVYRGLLQAGAADAQTIAQLQNAISENQGRPVRFLYAQQLAVLLYDAGDVEAALELIGQSLETLPAEMEQERAQFQMLATLCSGLERVAGRQAFAALIANNRFASLMSIALQKSFSRARIAESSGEGLLRETLDWMIAGSPDHLLRDQALYYRAVFRFVEGDYAEAEDDAARLQSDYPNSPFRRGMLALQASSAWNRQRYRTAASRLQQMRMEFVDLENDFRLSALIADCYLRAGERSSTLEDYRNAAEAYSTALANVTTPSQAGPLFFQLVYARVGGGLLDAAIEAVDDPSLRDLAGSEMTWRAEWMVMRELRRSGRELEAYDRVQSAVAQEVETPQLRMRLLWLAARLSVMSGDADYTEDWVAELEDLVEGMPEESRNEDLRERVMASSLLSLADARFAQDRSEEAVSLLEQIRAEYAGHEAAILSYIAQARYLSLKDRVVEAQQLLVSLADEYVEHPLAPVALFEAALNAERRGQDAYLDEATKLLERIATDYPQSDIFFRARLMQADLLRRLNKFGAAEYIYDLLEQDFSDRPDVYLAQLSLASTLLAQVDRDPGAFERAVSKLELLMDSPEVGPDARIEAGYMLGQAWRTHGEELKAKQVFWLLHDQMLGEQESSAVLSGWRVEQLGKTGRYWLSRCLFALAEMSQSKGQLEQALYFYDEISGLRLPGAELAQARLRALARPLSGAKQEAVN